MSKVRQLNVRLDEDLLVGVRAEAFERGVGGSRFVRDCLVWVLGLGLILGWVWCLWLIGLLRRGCWLRAVLNV